MDEKLIKAIFAAGFRAGYDNGIDNATAWEWGSGHTNASDPDEAWEEDVEPYLNTDVDGNKLDINDPNSWENIP